MAKKTNNFEMRHTSVRADALAVTDEGVVEGYPVVYGVPANIGGQFTEYIERGALDNCDLKDVQFLVNHNGQGITLARSRNNNENSTMQLTPDDKGLKMTTKLDIENNQEARALFSAIKRGDISGMSFMFSVGADEWEDLKGSSPIRRISAIRHIREISAVNCPAYPDTSITARSVETDSALENARAALDSADHGALLDLEKAKIQTLLL